MLVIKELLGRRLLGQRTLEDELITFWLGVEHASYHTIMRPPVYPAPCQHLKYLPTTAATNLYFHSRFHLIGFGFPHYSLSL
jgi:hypothetical protein